MNKTEIMHSTRFLDVYEGKPNLLALRKFCIKNNIQSIPKCKGCDKHATFYYDDPRKGFRLFCGADCSRTNKRLDSEIHNKLSDKSWLESQRKAGLSNEDIAVVLGCSFGPVLKALRVHDIDINEGGNRKRNTDARVSLTYEVIYKEYVVNNKTLNTIAKEYNTYIDIVQKIIKQHNIDIKKPNQYDKSNKTQSIKELNLIDYIRSIYSGEILTGNRVLLGNGFELDIVIPEHNLAIEFNGNFYHLEQPEQTTAALKKDRKYHLNKTLICEQKGYQLLHFFEDEWDNKQDIIKSMICNKLKLTSTRIFARKCRLVEVDKRDRINFYNANHIQGGDQAKVAYGLVYDGILVSVMSFGIPRFTRDIQWELIRFANKINTNVIGGFSKLLKYFRLNHSGSIISYADRRISTGNVYSRNGFTLTRTNLPSYSYLHKNTNYLVRYSRMQFQKKRLYKKFNDNIDRTQMTELEMVTELGYKRIWDCGTLTYVYT